MGTSTTGDTAPIICVTIVDQAAVSAYLESTTMPTSSDRILEKLGYNDEYILTPSENQYLFWIS